MITMDTDLNILTWEEILQADIQDAVFDSFHDIDNSGREPAQPAADTPQHETSGKRHYSDEFNQDDVANGSNTKRQRIDNGLSGLLDVADSSQNNTMTPTALATPTAFPSSGGTRTANFGFSVNPDPALPPSAPHAYAASMDNQPMYFNPRSAMTASTVAPLPPQTAILARPSSAQLAARFAAIATPYSPTPVPQSGASTTRPTVQRTPLERIQADLELSNETFNNFRQEVATYVEDSNRPDRLRMMARTRSKKDLDAARAIKKQAVKEFLDQDGYGARYFALQPGVPRTWHWPNDPELAEAVVTPVFEHAVALHRARETRDANRAARCAQIATPAAAPAATPAAAAISPARLTSQPRTYVSVVTDNAGSYDRIAPRMMFLGQDIANYDHFLRDLAAMLSRPLNVSVAPVLGTVDVNKCMLLAFGPWGLMEIDDAADWKAFLLAVQGAEWMDREVRILLVV
jgi:hypothetical protein